MLSIHAKLARHCSLPSFIFTLSYQPCSKNTKVDSLFQLYMADSKKVSKEHMLPPSSMRLHTYPIKKSLAHIFQTGSLCPLPSAMDSSPRHIPHQPQVTLLYIIHAEVYVLLLSLHTSQGFLHFSSRKTDLVSLSRPWSFYSAPKIRKTGLRLYQVICLKLPKTQCGLPACYVPQNANFTY